MGILEIGRVFTRRAPLLPNVDLGKRFASTKGYRPAKPVELVSQSDTMTSQKLRFLDARQERLCILSSLIERQKKENQLRQNGEMTYRED